jgi:Zn-dependent protease with chaperone function
VTYGLSVQSWVGWWGDQAKSFVIGLLGSILFFALLMWIIRRLPRSWWVVCWAVVMPLVLFLIYLSPVLIDPLFNKFEPLQQSHPELVARLEEVVKKGHMEIPPERMFLMQASAKVTTINAYVTGFGGSKRVVVWDTSLQKGTPDQVLFIFGHESGHYVLGHVVRGLIMTFFGLLVAFFLGYHFVRWSLRRFGPRWRITAQTDWGALAVLFFAFALFSVVLQPVINSLSRIQEHAADVYGEEAIHGLVADPQETVRGAFTVLGQSVLEVPNPNQLLEFWTENHPATGRRAAFGKAYNPWAVGFEPKYFPSPTAQDGR